MQWFFLLIILLGLGYLAANAFVGADPQALARAARLIGGFGAIGLGVALSLFGRVIFGAPLVLFGLMMLGRRLSLGGIGGRRSAGQASRVRTATVEMTLDHDTGEIDGQVLAGSFAGRALSALGLADLLDLRRQCLARDPRAAQLVEAYLDRAHEDWRQGAGEGAGRAGEGASAPEGGPMSREEAYEILGLKPGCSSDDVRRAHRQLMKKLHPDLGGSTYLAAKVNEAKDLLLGRR